MGTRYEQGDFVFSGNELGEILKVENPRSDSPTYHVNHLGDRTQQPPEHMKASELRKADLNGYHPDTVKEMLYDGLEDASDLELARSESSKLRIDHGLRGDRVRVASSGDYVAVNGHTEIENRGTFEQALQEAGYDPSNWERDSSKGGKIPARETEVQVFYIIEDVQKETGIDMETLQMIFESYIGTYDGEVTYYHSSGNVAEFEKVNE